MLPNFIIIGAPRAGSTYLYRCLAEHPEIYMPAKKELNFFTDWWGKGLFWYERFFDAHEGQPAVGEASVGYTATKEYDVVERMAGVVPDAKLIYVVRDPVERVWSHYVFMHRSQQGDERSFHEVAEGHLEGSEYHRWITRYLEHYDRAQLLVVSTEQLTGDPETHIPRVFEHIGVDSTFRPENMHRRINPSYEPKRKRLLRLYKRLVSTPAYKKVSSSWLRRSLQARLPARFARRGNFIRALVGMKTPPRMPNELRAWLQDYYQDDVRALEAFLGRELTEWSFSSQNSPESSGL